MVPRRARWTAGFAVILAVVAAGGLRAEDKSAEDVLKGHGLKRVGTTYVLGPAEADVQRKVNELRLLSRQLNLARQQQEALELGTQNREAMIQEMRQQRMLLDDHIKALNQQIALGAQLQAQRNEAVLTYNSLTDRIQMLQGQGADQVQNQIRTEVSQRRETYIQAVLDLRQHVDATTKSYADLAKDDEIKKALTALGPKSNVPLKLGPSREFLGNVKVLERVEKSVLTDVIELRRTGGNVFEVDVMFNGKVTKPMIFDTGAGITSIPASLAAEIGLTTSPTDPVITCRTADGTVVEARQKTIPTMRVGRVTVHNVVCAVMPSEKRRADPLLGQSFLEHVDYKFSPQSGRLVMSQIEPLEQPQAKTGGRPPRNSATGKRPTRSKSAAGKVKAIRGPDGE
jgi:clan AA aspartic protease (TIGR02281 family)